MRVLYFMNHADHGGAVLALYDLIVELKSIYSDYYPIVITGKKNKLNEMLSDIGVENYHADFKNFLSSYKNPYFFTHAALLLRYEIGKIVGINKIERIIDFKTIDIIHSNLDRIDIGAILSQKYNIPHIWHIREHTKIYTGLIIPKSYENNEEETDFKLVSVKQNPIEYMTSFSKGNNCFIAISNSVKNEWEKKGLPPESIHLIYDGIRFDLFNIKDISTKCLQNNEKKINMVFLGGYCKEKGQEELIKALLKLAPSVINKLKIDFYGSGDGMYIERIRELAKPLIDDRIVTINAYDPNIYCKLSNYDIGFNCSNAEGFGRVTVEYMMAGLCPIVSNTGANIELIENEINGIIYKKGTLEDLVKKINHIVSNPDIIHKYGVAARHRAAQLYTMNTHSKKIMKLYQDLLR